MQTILLNGKTYTLRPDKDGRTIRRTKMETFANAFRPEGRLSTESVVHSQPFNFPNPIRGIGKTRIRNHNDPTEFEYVKDSTALTRYKTGYYNATLSNTATAPSNPASVTLGAMKALLVQGTTVYGYWSADSEVGGTPSNPAVYQAQYSAGSWNNSVTQVYVGVGTVDSDRVSVFDAKAVNATVRLVCFASRERTVDTQLAQIYRWDGSTWGSVYTLATGATTAMTWDENINGGALLVDGATVWAALWQRGAATPVINIAKSTDSGATFASYGSITATGGPTGLAIYPDDAGTDMLMVGSAEGVWAVNMTTFAASILPGLDFRNQVSSENCKGMIAKQGSLYVPLGNGYHTYVKYTWDGNAAHIQYVGPGSMDGLPTARQGAITAVCEGDRWAFWAAGGLAASKNASVFSWCPEHDALHHEWQNGTANRRIDAIAIANGTLHVAERTGTNTTVMRYHDNILDDPSQVSATVKHETSSAIERPKFNFGFPGDKKNFESIAYEADSLSAANTGEYINVDQDIDETGSYTDVGDILSGDKDLDLSSGLGLAGSTIRIKENLIRDAGTNTDTPKVHGFKLTAKVRPAVKYRYEFDLDVDLCARRAGSYSLLDTELQALLPDTQIVKVALAYGIKAGSLGTRMVSKNVYVEDIRYRESVESDVPDGTIRVMVSEA